jgi:hypothetical protein
MTAPLAHPAWCSPTNCTVIGELLPLTGTTHRSGPIDFDLGVFAPGRRRNVTVRLSQAVAPWPTDVFVIASDSDGDELLSLRVEAARDMLATLGALIGRAFPPLDQDRPAAETATRHGSPATADDDYCRVHPDCYSVRWLGESDNAENVWSCDVSGAQWRTKVRRPGNSVPYVLVLPYDADVWELTCLACGRDLRPRYPDEATARGAAAEHTAEHERQITGGDR